MNQFLKLHESKFAIFALLVFSSVLGISSYYNPTAELTVSPPLDKVWALMRYAIYAVTLFLIIARFKSVVRPAIRDPFLWGLVVIVVTSFLWSDFPSISRKDGLILLMATLFGLYLASRFSLKEQVRIVAWALGIVTVFSLLYSLVFRGAAVETGFNAGAWRGPMLQKNLLARLMVICAPPLLMVALEKNKYRYVVWIVFIMAVALIVLSTSKSALIICLTLLFLLPLYNAMKWSDSLVIPLSISLILILGFATTALVSNWEPFLFKLGKDPTLTGRTDIWAACLEKIWQRPWLGYGYQAFWQDGGGGEYVWKIMNFRVYSAHNGLLNIAVELGFTGMSFFLLSVVTAYIRGLICVRANKRLEDLWPITCVTFLLMYNQTESTNTEPNSIFWILYVAATLSMRRVPMMKPRAFSEDREDKKLVEPS